MAKFLVDSRTLLAVRVTLGRLRDQLLGVHTVVGGYDGVLGGRALEIELEQFCGHWHDDIVDLGGQITNMMRRLLGAAAAYQRIEDRIVASGNSGGAPVAPHPHSPVGSGTTTIGGGPTHVTGGHSGAGHSGTGHPGGYPVGSGKTVIGGGGGGGGGGSSTGDTGGGRHARGGHHGGHRGGSGSGSGETVIDVRSPLLTTGQEKFVGKLAALTGLNPRVVGAWTLAEESSGYAEGREVDGNNNWLNIGYSDDGPGAIAFNGAFDDPETAAEKTSHFLQGGWAGASPSICAILDSAGRSPEHQLAAISASNWASSHYGDGRELRATYHELAGINVRTS